MSIPLRQRERERRGQSSYGWLWPVENSDNDSVDLLCENWSCGARLSRLNSALAGHPFFEQISAYFVSHLFKLPSQHTITDILNIWVSRLRWSRRWTASSTAFLPSSVKPFKRYCRDRSFDLFSYPLIRWCIESPVKHWTRLNKKTRTFRKSNCETYLRAFRFIAFALSLLSV